MNVKMKVLDYPRLMTLNRSSIRAGRKQNMTDEQLPADTNRQYIVNFHFEHKYGDTRDVRMSVVLEPAVLTAWLDVSPEEYSAIPEVEMSEFEWEAAVCVGTPRWVE